MRTAITFFLFLCLISSLPAEKVRWEGILTFRQTQSILPRVDFAVKNQRPVKVRNGISFVSKTSGDGNTVSQCKTDENGHFSLQFDPEEEYLYLQVTLPGDYKLYYHLSEWGNGKLNENELPDTFEVDLLRFSQSSGRYHYQIYNQGYFRFFQRYRISLDWKPEGPPEVSCSSERAVENMATFLTAFPTACVLPTRTPDMQENEWQAILGFFRRELTSRGVKQGQMIPLENLGDNTSQRTEEFISSFPVSFQLQFEADRDFSQ